ncbi:MAG TPA: agmatinase family protein [Gemmatimonadales bacterium]|jgi:agmatinase|nr:agmatinase family protein [Gemmatimonadales bacterium]
MALTKVALLGVPYDAGSSYQRGPAGAPMQIREALWSEAGNTWAETGTDLKDGGLEDEGDLWFTDREPGDDARARIEEAVGSILDSHRRPLLLGGDHSITYPALRGLRPHHPRLAILHLDAHPDLYHEFQGDPYSHACPFARIMEERLADRLVQVGIRTMTGHQREQAERFGVEMIEMRSWRDGTPLRFETPVYLSLDLDVLEPALAPGVSHREPGGLTVRQVVDIIQGLDAPLAGADLVELNPLNDPSGLSAAVAAKLVKEIAARMLTETR